MTKIVRRYLPALAIGLLCLVAPRIGAAVGDGVVAGEIRVTKGGKRQTDASKIVVYLQGVPESGDTKRKHAIRQHNIQFDPRVSVVVKNTTVDFPNEDKVFHNVFSTSRSARFDLGLYRSGSSKAVEFKREGVVDVFCNIHPDMASRVLVVPTSHYAVTDASGKFRIDGVPPGKYPVVAWPTYGEETRGTVTIEAGRVATLTLDVTLGDKPVQHPRKDGTPYGRYE